MQIDFARFPEIPQGSYSQSTADPDVLLLEDAISVYISVA